MRYAADDKLSVRIDVAVVRGKTQSDDDFAGGFGTKHTNLSPVADTIPANKFHEYSVQVFYSAS